MLESEIVVPAAASNDDSRVPHVWAVADPEFVVGIGLSFCFGIITAVLLMTY